jgi:DNA modification methylase
MRLEKVRVDSIHIPRRFRTPDEARVPQIASSIETVGLLNPITLDEAYTLLCGYHRVLAFKMLGKEYIDAHILHVETIHAQIAELDENAARVNLSPLEMAEHIGKREDLVEAMGYQIGSGINQHSSKKKTTKELAKELGMNERTYKMKKQVLNIHPELRDTLRQPEYNNFTKNLVDLVKLSQEDYLTQKAIVDEITIGNSREFRSAFIKGKIAHLSVDSSEDTRNRISEKYGYPRSIMNFVSDKESPISKIIEALHEDEDVRMVKSSQFFGYNSIKFHRMAPNQCLFSLDYYTDEGDVVLDNFAGRHTTALCALHLNRKFIGFEINKLNVDRANSMIANHLPVDRGMYELHFGDGVEMTPLQDKQKVIDAVFTSPPYYKQAEAYTENPVDLCNLDFNEFNKKMDVCFSNYSRLIKLSDWSTKKIHPVMLVVGTARDGKKGILDMDFEMQRIARNHGFVLHDKFFNVVHNPYLATALRRNEKARYVNKNHETTLVFAKFN